MTALSLSGGSGHDEDPGAISSPKPSKSVPKLRPVPRMRATTVSTTASVDAPGLVHPSYEARYISDMLGLSASSFGGG
jgi:hypothetical protein